MFWKKPVAASCTFYLCLFLLHYVTATYNRSCPHIQSCGSLTNIFYPFRLNGTHKNCGDRNFELICENNQTPILNLNHAKYLVKAINYTDSTIQVVDIGVQDNNCSSLPSHSISGGNFTSLHDNSYDIFHFQNILVMFISCENPQKSHFYVNSSACLSTKSKNSYMVLDDMASSIPDSCSIDLIFPVLLSPLSTKDLTYTELHRFIANGFVLYWNSWKCADCKGQGDCLYNTTTSIVTCAEPCTFKHVTSLPCLFQLLCQIGIYITYGLYYSVMPVFPVGQIYINPLGIFIAVRFICGAICVLVLLIYKWRRRHLSMYDSIEEFLQNNNNLMPIRYSYSQIKKITNNFKDKLGQGGYDSVYKGKLQSGYLVAVKLLGKSKATEIDFMNEVATIGRIHHINIVHLIGFCVDRSKRALVFDFMSNGSLDKYVLGQESSTSLSWEKMLEISLGIARGIEYLHRGCEMQILHFDIKPHNILLDENFIPKVSDFGLAKLYPTTRNTIPRTMARGTIGYIAPELINKGIGNVSHKADVYSFGMLLMNMAGKTKNLNVLAEHSSQKYFPVWSHYQVVNGKEVERDGTEEEKRIAKKIVLVGMWCIQMNPTIRPSMNKVLEMLEGDLESLEVPPRPSTYPEAKLENEDGENTNESSSGTNESESSSLITSMTSICIEIIDHSASTSEMTSNSWRRCLPAILPYVLLLVKEANGFGGVVARVQQWSNSRRELERHLEICKHHKSKGG